MKFGKILQQSSQLCKSEWESYWIDYKRLKGIVKDCAHIDKEQKLDAKKLRQLIQPDVHNDTIGHFPAEKNFFRSLHVEMGKIKDFFLHQQTLSIDRVSTLEGTFKKLKSSNLVKDPAEKTRLMAGCVELYKELLLLENYAVINYCGFSKILKKHDKWTGYNTRQKFIRQIVSKQPFSTYEPLLKMIGQLEHMYMEITGISIDQHEKPGKVGTENENDCTPVHGENLRGRLNSEDQVTLFKIHSLRDDTSKLKETECLDSISENTQEDDCDDDVEEAISTENSKRKFEEIQETISKEKLRDDQRPTKMMFKTILN